MKLDSITVLDHVTDSWQGKSGKMTLQCLVCLDTSSPPLRNTFDYVMTDEEWNEHGKQLIGKRVSLTVKDLDRAFNGRWRFSGVIHPVAK